MIFHANIGLGYTFQITEKSWQIPAISINQWGYFLKTAEEENFKFSSSLHQLDSGETGYFIIYFNESSKLDPNLLQEYADMYCLKNKIGVKNATNSDN